MTAENAIKSKKGAALIWAIVFGLVISTLATILLTLVLSSTSSNAVASRGTAMRADLNQIGEYFLRSLGYKEDFPTGNETDYSNYAWLDESAAEFFAHCHEKYGYTYTVSSKHTDESDFLSGYKDKGNVYLLTVKSGDRTVLKVAVKEEIKYDTQQGFIIKLNGDPEASYTVLEWTVNESNDIYSDFQELGKGGLLKRLWRGIVGTVSGIVVKPTEYKVTLNANQGSNPGGPFTVERGSSIKLPDSTSMHRPGAAFLGWGEDKTTVKYNGGYSLTPTSNVTLNAIWRKYVITFDPKGGTLEKTQDDGKIPLPTPTREHYYFNGWYYKDSDGSEVKAVETKEESGKLYYIPTRDITLYAKWDEMKSYSVSYKMGEATEGTLPASAKKYEGESLTLSSTVLQKAEKPKTSVRTVTVDFYDNDAKVKSLPIKITDTATTTYKSNGWVNVENDEETYDLGAAYSADKAITLKPNFSGAAANTATTSNENDLSFDLPAALVSENNDFDGWYTAASEGTKIGNAGESIEYSKLGSATKLYARWTPKMVPVTITCGNYCSVSNQDAHIRVPYGTEYSLSGNKITFLNGSEVTLRANEGYKISGITGDTVNNSSGYEIKVTASAKSYTLALDITNAEVTLEYSGDTHIYKSNDSLQIPYNTEIKLSVKFNKDNDKSLSYPGGELKKDGSATFTMPANNATISAYSDSGCFTGDTLITLADGTQKKVEDVSASDRILAWDFFSGTYVERDICLLINHGYGAYDVINTEFSDGTALRIVVSHDLFDYDLNAFVNINCESCAEYIGHRFVKYGDNGSYEIVTLINAYSSVELTDCYSIASGESLNAFADGLLTLSPAVKFLNWIEMGGKLRYDIEKLNSVIEEYGIYYYDVFKDYVTYKQYVDYCGPYLKAGVEQGYYPFEYIIGLINEYNEFMP